MRHFDEVTVVVSELVTNALKYGKGQIRVVLRARRGEVFVAVQDRGSEFVVPLQVVDPFRVGGRGLSIVAEFASHCGIENLGEAGKVVWCVVHAGGRRASAAPWVRPGAAFLLGSSERIDERAYSEQSPRVPTTTVA